MDKGGEVFKNEKTCLTGFLIGLNTLYRLGHIFHIGYFVTTRLQYITTKHIYQL